MSRFTIITLLALVALARVAAYTAEAYADAGPAVLVSSFSGREFVADAMQGFRSETPKITART